MRFFKLLPIIVKVLVPVVFFAIAAWPGMYWLAGFMTVVVIGSYVSEYFLKPKV